MSLDVEKQRSKIAVGHWVLLFLKSVLMSPASAAKGSLKTVINKSQTCYVLSSDIEAEI